jgi:hypothetical protein
MRPRLSRIHDAGGALLHALANALVPRGLNLLGTARVADYDAAVPERYAIRGLAPEARTAVVIGNGGGEFWHAFRSHCARHPEHDRLADPLDAFTRLVVEEAVAANPTGAGARVVYPFRFPAEPVSFVHLAECAGLGRRSVAGVLVHPVFGPWIALRAAILLPAVVVAERAVPEDFDPCPSCVERACMPACPVGAVGPQGWDVPRCAAHRVSDPGACATRCEARFMCVIGREHRYPAEALAYHQARALPLLATRVGR